MQYKKFQSQFWSKLADPISICAIFEHLPEIAFFVKDSQGRIVTVSSSILQRLGLSSLDQFVGRTDSEFYPEHMVETYIADDEWVFRTGKTLQNRLEVWLDEKGRPDWSITTKVPLFGKHGEVVGLMGICRRDLQLATSQPGSQATKAVAHLRKHISQPMTLEELASGIGVSTRTLNRKINMEFGISPYELILRIRIQATAEALLKTDKEISEIALAHGFCDQSHFTQHFKKRMGMTPRRFRASRASVIRFNAETAEV